MIFNLNEEEVMSNQFENMDLSTMFELPEVKETVDTSKETTEVKVDETKEKVITSYDDGTFEIPEFTKVVAEETTDEETTDWTEATEVVDDNTEVKDIPSTDKGSSSSSPFRPFAKALLEEGILSSFDEEEFTQLSEEFGGEAEALLELSRRSITDAFESYKNEQEEDYKAFLEAKESGVDMNAWSAVYDKKKAYSTITDENISADETLQKKLITENFTLSGMDEESIKETIESLEDTGKLEISAKRALKNLKKYEDQREIHMKEETALNDKKREEQRLANIANLKKSIEDTVEIVPGIKLNKQTKDKLYESITKPVKTGPNGEPINVAMSKRMENPIKYAIIENYLVELGVFDGKFDKIMTKAKTKAITDLKNVLSDKSNTGFDSGKSTLKKGRDDNDIDDKPMFGGI